MPRRKKDEDFNTQIHAMYERISAGESSHDDEPPALSAEPPPAERPKKPEKVFDPSVNPAQWLGQRGGKKGGKARTDSMTPEERKKLASDAAKARWAKKDDGGKRFNNG